MVSSSAPPKNEVLFDLALVVIVSAPLSPETIELVVASREIVSVLLPP
jgi:hypothetical protein